jgi:hypothetical protein
MPRLMSETREREYGELFGYLDFYATHVMGIDPADPVHPANVGRGIAEQFGKSKVLDGLRQAVNETVEALIDQTPARIAQLDASLSKLGLLTHSEVRRRYASSYKRLLKRGRIATETEFYLVAGILADTGSQVTVEERARLELLCATFEARPNTSLERTRDK